MRKLNLGCGDDYKEGWVNADLGDFAKKDVVVNLENIPYPFKDNEFDYIFTAHTLEHIDLWNMGNTMIPIFIELHRMLKPGGKLEVRVPHFSHHIAISNLGLHRNSFSLDGFNVLCDNDLMKYEPKVSVDDRPLFKIVSKKLMYQRLDRGGELLVNKGAYYYIAKFISFLANLSPSFCERVWCQAVGGFQEMQIVLEKVKQKGSDGK